MKCSMVRVAFTRAGRRQFFRVNRSLGSTFIRGFVLCSEVAEYIAAHEAAGVRLDDECQEIRYDERIALLVKKIEAANGKPVLVMYAYQHDLTRIQQRFGKYGPENPNGVRELKTSADLEDWNAGKIPVAVTQPASTGHGLNLQHGGSTIVWFGLNWSLELYEQANARLWRQGQKETVVVHHLVVKGTMDEQVMRALHEKAADQNALLAAVKARIQEVK